MQEMYLLEQYQKIPKLFLNKGKVHNNSDFCLAAYNKKQEFDGGDIVYNEIFCDKENFFNDNFQISKK